MERKVQRAVERFEGTGPLSRRDGTPIGDTHSRDARLADPASLPDSTRRERTDVRGEERRGARHRHPGPDSEAFTPAAAPSHDG